MVIKSSTWQLLEFLGSTLALAAFVTFAIVITGAMLFGGPEWIVRVSFNTYHEGWPELILAWFLVLYGGILWGRGIRDLFAKRSIP